MIYGLYLSAAGVMTSSYKEDVIANNLANVETTGFKRSDAQFRQRLTESQESRRPGTWSDSALEGLGGGMLVLPTGIDFGQGALQKTSSALDVGIEGDGFLAVQDGDQTRLTRDGRLSVSRDGFLTAPNGKKVLDTAGKPIALRTDAPTDIGPDGVVHQDGQRVAMLGVFDVQDRSTLKQTGGNLLTPSDPSQLRTATGRIHSEFLEDSNADPTSELSQLMDAQRQLEANANLIRTQDSTLQRLVNDVGKIS